MTKLRRKMFFLLFGMLSLVIILLAALFNYREYVDEKQSVIGMLKQIQTVHDLSGSRFRGQRELDEEDRIYISDLPVAIAYLDEEGEPSVFYTSGDEFDQEELISKTKGIVAEKGPGDYEIPDLFRGGYAYSFQNPGVLSLVDLDPVRDELWESLGVTLLLVLLAEAGAVIISRILVRWMLEPIEQTLQRQKEFIADSSHELKTPLAVIIASADAMATDPDPKWLHNIESESARMSSLISRMLELTRSENPEPAMMERQNLSRLSELALLPYESIAFEKGFKLEYNIEPDLWVRCDGANIKQIVAILIDNALQHTYPGHIIQLDLYRVKEQAYLVVKNQGDPIQPGQEEKIFERFYRADEARSRSANRYGLGLAIARNIVQNHKGSIRAWSRDGWTVFEVRLKLAPKEK